MAFYRAYSTAQRSAWDCRYLGGSVFSLSLRGQVAAHYPVQTTPNLVPPDSSNFLSVTLTNSREIFNWTNPGDSKRFFRTVSP